MTCPDYSNRYMSFQDIINNVYERDNKRLRVTKQISVDFFSERYEIESQKNVGILSTNLIVTANLLKYRTKTFIVSNKGPGTLIECYLQTSPNGVDWETIDCEYFDDMTSGEIRSLSIIDSRKYFRIIAKSDSNSYVESWVYATYL